jgi:hypothetical protein
MTTNLELRDEPSLFDKGWNAALEAAVKAVHAAPVFPKDGGGPRMDGERIIILDRCAKQIAALRRS